MSLNLRSMVGLRSMVKAVGLVALGAAALFAGGCSSLPPETGPTVGVRNDSDAPLRATFWVGDRNDQRPGQHADMSSQRTLNIAPFGTTQYKLNAFSGYDSSSLSFVRVQIQPVGSSFQSNAQQWFELNPPMPYTLRVYGHAPKLQYERVGGGSMVAVPPNLWFQNAGGAIVTSKINAKNPAMAPANMTPTSNSPMKKTSFNRPLTATTVAKPSQVTGVPENSGMPND